MEPQWSKSNMKMEHDHYVKESDNKENDPPEHLKIQGKPLKHNPLKHLLSQ